LVREIATSHTFALASQHDDHGFQRDPDNRLLWRAHRRRLDPESLRDAMLLAAGELDLRPMQSTVWYLGDQATGVGINARRRTDFPCRSVYLPVIRNDLPELFDVFDFANPHSTTGARPRTTVATQALFLLNNDLVMDTAAAISRRLLAAHPNDPPHNDAAIASDAARVRQLYEWIVQDEPTDGEVSVLTRFAGTLRETEASTPPPAGGAADAGSPADVELRVWTRIGHTVLALSRFQFVE